MSEPVNRSQSVGLASLNVDSSPGGGAVFDKTVKSIGGKTTSGLDTLSSFEGTPLGDRKVERRPSLPLLTDSPKGKKTEERWSLWESGSRVSSGPGSQYSDGAISSGSEHVHGSGYKASLYNQEPDELTLDVDYDVDYEEEKYAPTGSRLSIKPEPDYGFDEDFSDTLDEGFELIPRKSQFPSVKSRLPSEGGDSCFDTDDDIKSSGTESFLSPADDDDVKVTVQSAKAKGAKVDVKGPEAVDDVPRLTKSDKSFLKKLWGFCQKHSTEIAGLIFCIVGFAILCALLPTPLMWIALAGVALVAIVTGFGLIAGALAMPMQDYSSAGQGGQGGQGEPETNTPKQQQETPETPRQTPAAAPEPAGVGNDGESSEGQGEPGGHFVMRKGQGGAGATGGPGRVPWGASDAGELGRIFSESIMTPLAEGGLRPDLTEELAQGMARQVADMSSQVMNHFIKDEATQTEADDIEAEKMAEVFRGVLESVELDPGRVTDMSFELGKMLRSPGYRDVVQQMGGVEGKWPVDPKAAERRERLINVMVDVLKEYGKGASVSRMDRPGEKEIQPQAQELVSNLLYRHIVKPIDSRGEGITDEASDVVSQIVGAFAPGPASQENRVDIIRKGIAALVRDYQPDRRSVESMRKELMLMEGSIDTPLIQIVREMSQSLSFAFITYVEPPKLVDEMFGPDGFEKKSSSPPFLDTGEVKDAEEEWGSGRLRKRPVVEKEAYQSLDLDRNQKIFLKAFKAELRTVTESAQIDRNNPRNALPHDVAISQESIFNQLVVDVMSDPLNKSIRELDFVSELVSRAEKDGRVNKQYLELFKVMMSKNKRFRGWKTD